MKGHVGAAKALLKAGANVSAVSSKGLTPLHMAVQSGACCCHFHPIDSASAPPAPRGAPLMRSETEGGVCARAGSGELVQWLLRKRADASAVTKQKKTAADMAKTAEMRTLLQEGAAAAAAEAAKVAAERAAKRADKAAVGDTSVSDRRAKARVKTEVEEEQKVVEVEGEAPSAAGGQGKRRKKMNVMPAHLAADDDDVQDEF